MRLVRWLAHVDRDGDNSYRSVYLLGAHLEFTLWDKHA